MTKRNRTPADEGALAAKSYNAGVRAGAAGLPLPEAVKMSAEYGGRGIEYKLGWEDARPQGK